MDAQRMKKVVEALLMASPRPLQFNELAKLLAHDGKAADRATLGEALAALEAECDGRAVELTQVASGYRYQTREEYAPWLAKLWEEKPPRYSRALLETLALIAYRQPLTRAAIEEVRGVSVSTNTVRTLEERGWIEVAGHKETPGRPALYATTRAFLDDFNLRSLDDLPTLAPLPDPQDMLKDGEIPGSEGMTAPQATPEDGDTRDNESMTAPQDTLEDGDTRDNEGEASAPVQLAPPPDAEDGAEQGANDGGKDDGVL
ncbi:MAG: SMC-Scp complex subunit ScpB [Gammaproteobacteria bacterium]|nr:SMC-Scp complex subunit ScpB [Gammaproteobacteria bacterium]